MGQLPIVVVSDQNGGFYGTTFGGGGFADGTIFHFVRSTNHWTLNTLYSFKGSDDGIGPTGPLALGADGTLYGTTEEGGAQNSGVAFALTPNAGGWTETILHTFEGGSDGSNPLSGLIFAQDGGLVGTTYDGGNALCMIGSSVGCGTVFDVVP